MPGERKPFVKLRAIVLTTCLLLAGIAGPMMGPVAVGGVSAQSGTTFTAGNAAANPGNTAEIDISYDVISEGVDAEDLVINVYESGKMNPVGNTDTLTELTGDTTVDIEVANTPGDYRVSAEIREKGTSSATLPIESDSATIDVTSLVGATGFTAPVAANTGDQIDLTVDVENTDSQSRDVRLQAYFDDFASPTGHPPMEYDAPKGESSTTLKATVPDHIRPGPHEVTVNDKGTKPIMVSDPDVSFSGLSVTTGDGSITATATVTNNAGNQQEINVPLYVDGEITNTKQISLGAGNYQEVSLDGHATTGDHEVGIGDLTPESVTVEAGGGPGDGPGDGDGSNDYEDETPGYDVIKAINVDTTGVGNAPTGTPMLRVSEPNGNTLMDAEVLTPSERYELADIGADSSTQFEFEVKVHEDHEPLMLLGTAQDVTWTKEPLPGESYYKVTVTANPMAAQYVDTPPKKWGNENDGYYTAESAYEAMLTVSFVTSDMLDATLDGATIATDAQSVGMPTYDQQSLGLYVGGPHYAKDGSVNTGEYEAFLPDALLSEWGVTSPTEELRANFGDQQFDSDTDGFVVTDENVPGGVLVEFPIHYSEGTVSVSPAEAGSDSTTSSSPSYPSHSRNSGSTTTAESTTTETSGDSASDSTSTSAATTAPETTTTQVEPPTETETSADTTTETDPTTRTDDSTTDDAAAAGGVPGFGVGAALVALVAAALLALRRSH